MLEEKQHSSSENEKNDVNTECTSKIFINTSDSQKMKGKMDPFRKSTQTAKEDFFDVGFEASQDLTGTSCTLSQNSNIEHAEDIFKNPKKFKQNKSKVEDPFDIDFEESQEASSQGLLSTPQIESQKSPETCSQDSTINLKKPKLFKNPKLSSNNAFDIDFEESGQALSQNTQNSQSSGASSQKSVNALSQGETGRPPLFQKRKRRANAIEVDFEESCQNEQGELPQNTEMSQSPECNKENIEDTSISFEKHNPFQVAKKQQLSKSFDLDFEESRNITDVLNTSHTTPTKSGVVPFRKSSNAPEEDDFTVDFSQTDFGNNINTSVTEKSGQVMRNASTISKRNSLTSEPTRTNAPETESDFNQSSFNDDNLGHWMSDQSEDEIEIDKSVTREESGLVTLLPDEICPPDIENEEDEHELQQEEDHMQQLKLKLKEIIDSARNGKVQDKSLITIREKEPEKPKMIQKKCKPFVKPALKKPAPFATKRLYDYIITKIRPKYGIDSVVHAEELVIYMCDVVKTVVRRKAYQKKLINDLKMEMAKMGIIETTYQFYDFIREFLPYEFRLKTVPCIQPGTNIVYPPKDAVNPFQKILK